MTTFADRPNTALLVIDVQNDYIHPDGYILTSAHVVEGATEVSISVLHPRGGVEEYPARVVGEDDRTDCALLKSRINGRSCSHPRELPGRMCSTTRHQSRITRRCWSAGNRMR